MKSKKLVLPLIIFVLGCVYLLLPSPQVPDLSGSDRSDEPGDTWQHPDQKAFFTERVRSEVISELQSKFSLNILGVAIPSYRLNYRPEESYEFVRDQVKSYYLEEVVYPLKESLFINGFEPSNSPEFRRYNPKDRPRNSFRGRDYLSKVTLRPVYSHPLSRVLVWAGVFPSVYLVFYSIKRSLTI